MKKLKVLALVLAAALACMSLTACGGSSSGSSDNSGSGDASAAGGEETKTIVVATSPDFPPFESLENNEIVGIEVDIMDLIAQDLGMTVKYEQMDFDSVIPGVQAGKFDVGMSGITITEDRQKNCDFTNPYFMASQAIVVTPDSPITARRIWKERRSPSRPAPPLRSTAWTTATRCWPSPPTTMPPPP